MIRRRGRAMRFKGNRCSVCLFLSTFYSLRTNKLFLEVMQWFVHHGFLLRVFFGAVEVAKGRTTVVAFFGLSSLLKKKIARV
jgi:hypothetical protein